MTHNLRLGRAIFAVLLSTLLTHTLLMAQVPTPTAAPAVVGNSFILDSGTPVKLRLTRNLSSADATTGDQIDFEVLDEVKVHDVVVINKGGVAIGTITNAEHKKRMGRGGKLDLMIDYVKLVDGEKAALSAVKDTKGGGHVGAMTTGIVVTALVLWPAAPLFLLMHGKDVTIPKGTEITAYINGVMPLNIAQFTAADIPAVASVAVSVSLAAQLEVTSNPTGAEISVDGSFVGDTPTNLSVLAGTHTVSISQTGYQTWERQLTVSSGNVTVAAELVR